MIPSKSGRNLETGEPGDGASSPPHYAMHNIHTQSTHLFMPLAHASFAAGNIPVATAWQARKELFEEQKNKKEEKKKRFFSPEAPILPHQAPARGPRTLSTGRPRPGHRAPFHCPGGPFANPPETRGTT